jgi:hypothetical protein
MSVINKEIIELIVIIYNIIGLIFISLNYTIPNWFIVCGMYSLFKIITNYRKCTISYLECKIRGVKREFGYLNSLLDGITDLRYDLYYLIYIIIMMTIFLYYHYIIKKNKLNLF